MAGVRIDSGEFPTAKGATGGSLDRIIGKWQKKIAGGFNEGAEWLLSAIDEVDELRLWELYETRLYPMTRNEFIARNLLLDFAVVESTIPAILDRLKAGEPVQLERKSGGQVELSIRVAEARERPLADGPGKPEGSKGGNQHTANVDNINISKPATKGGTGTTYTLRRLARDAPELLDRIEAGELTVNAAAIAAGIRKRPTPDETCLKSWRKSSDRLGVLKSILAELSPEETETVRGWLT